MRDEMLELAQLSRFESGESAIGAMALSRTLVELAAEFEPGAGLRLGLWSETGERAGAVRFGISAIGPVPRSWQQDVRDLLAPAGKIELTAMPVRPRQGAAIEIVPSREATVDLPGRPLGAAPMDPGPQSIVAEERRLRRRRPEPAGLLDDLFNLCGALAAHPGSGYVAEVGGVSDLEAELLYESMTVSWSGSQGDLATYFGQPVRLRALLTAPGQTVPARLRSAVRSFVHHVAFVPATDGERPKEVSDRLTAPARPVGMAYALARVPVAGKRAVPGMHTRPASALRVPLDPIPERPQRAIRLGAAHTSTGTPIEAVLDVADLTAHAQVVGGSGSGKTSLLTQLAASLCSAGIGFVFLDFHGDVSRNLPAVIGDEDAERLSIIDHGDVEWVVPVNPFAGDEQHRELALAQFLTFLEAFFDPHREGIWGPRASRVFTLVHSASQAVFGPLHSLLVTTHFLGDQQLLMQLAGAARSVAPDTAKALTMEVGELSGREGAEVLAWVNSKFHGFEASSYLRAILGSGVDAVDMAHVMNEARCLVVNLNLPHLGPVAAKLLGTMWLIKCRLAAMKRASVDEPFVIIIDECHLVQDGILPRMLDELRKWGVGIVIAHQRKAQLDMQLRDAADANIASFIAMRTTSHADAAAASIRLDGWPADDLARLPKLRGAATLSRDGVPTAPFSLDVDLWQRSPVDEQAVDERRDEIRYGTLDEYCLPFTRERPMTTVEMDDFVRPGSGRRRDAAARRTEPDRAAPGSTQTGAGTPGSAPSGTGTSGSAFLDQWLAARDKSHTGSD